MGKHIILASGSKIRASMLEVAGLKFSATRPEFDEDSYKASITHLPLQEQSVILAEQKALSVSKNHPDALVIGADQICEFNGKPLSKPGNYKNAIQQLQALSGKTHHLHTAAAICHGDNTLWKYCETSTLTMQPITDEEIDIYVRKDEPYESCGSYRYESHGKELFSHIDGNKDTILGLPMIVLLGKLEEYNDA